MLVNVVKRIFKHLGMRSIATPRSSGTHMPIEPICRDEYKHPLPQISVLVPP